MYLTALSGLSPAPLQLCLEPARSRACDNVFLPAAPRAAMCSFVPAPGSFGAPPAPPSVDTGTAKVVTLTLAGARSHSRACDYGCVLVGTSDGHLQLHAGAHGVLLHRQRLHGSACLALRPRVAGAGLCPEDAAEDVTAVFRDALARVSALEASAPMQAPMGLSFCGLGC